MKPKLYTTKQAIKITGETRHRLQYWVVGQLLTPADPSAGTGTARGFSFANLLEILIGRALSLAGLHVALISFILRVIREEHPGFFVAGVQTEAPGSRRVLSVRPVSKRSGIVNVQTLEKTAKDLPALLSQGELLFQLDIDRIKRQLIEKIEEVERL